MEPHDCPTLAKRALVSASESCCGKFPHDSPALLHTVLQLWPLPPIFHSRMPAAVHASSVELAMLLLKPISPEDTTTSKEPGLYLPTPHRRHALTPVALEYAPAENLPASHALQVEATVAPTAAEYLPAGHDVHAAASE